MTAPTAPTPLTELESALISQAESTAREQQQHADTVRERLLAESADKLRLAEAHAVLAAKGEAERHTRLQIQAAQARQAAELDRLRWTLTESSLSALRNAFEALVADQDAYLATLEAWLAAAARALPAGDLVAEARPEDERKLAPIWSELAARAAPGRAVALCSHNHPSLGGLRIRTPDNRIRIDHTFEARLTRLKAELARAVMAQLFGENG